MSLIHSGLTAVLCLTCPSFSTSLSSARTSATSPPSGVPPPDTHCTQKKLSTLNGAEKYEIIVWISFVTFLLFGTYNWYRAGNVCVCLVLNYATVWNFLLYLSSFFQYLLVCMACIHHVGSWRCISLWLIAGFTPYSAHMNCTGTLLAAVRRYDCVVESSDAFCAPACIRTYTRTYRGCMPSSTVISILLMPDLCWHYCVVCLCGR